MDTSLALSPLSLVTPVVNYQFEKKAIKKQLAAQKELAQFQFDKNLEMWNLQNEYNSPASQMARYQQAGLNPHLVAGQGSSGNATSIPNYQLPSVDRAQLRFDNALDTLLKVQALQSNKAGIEGQELDNFRKFLLNSDIENEQEFNKQMRVFKLATETFNQAKRQWELEHNKIMGSKQEEKLRLEVFKEVMDASAQYATWEDFVSSSHSSATIKANQADASDLIPETGKQRLDNLVDQGGLIQSRKRAQDMENIFNEKTENARLLDEGINPNTLEVTNAKKFEKQVVPFVKVALQTVAAGIGLGLGLGKIGKVSKANKQARKFKKAQKAQRSLF